MIQIGLQPQDHIRIRDYLNFSVDWDIWMNKGSPHFDIGVLFPLFLHYHNKMVLTLIQFRVYARMVYSSDTFELWYYYSCNPDSPEYFILELYYNEQVMDSYIAN